MVKKYNAMKVVFPLRMDSQLYQALDSLSQLSERTKAQYIRFLIREDARKMGLIAGQVKHERFFGIS
jgi:predicted DNA-binding protein